MFITLFFILRQYVFQNQSLSVYLLPNSSSYMTLQLFYRVLAFSTSFSFHPLLSCARVFQFGTLSFCMSFLTSSIQRIFGLPVSLLETGFQEYIAFSILVPCILSTWPSQLSLCVQIKFTMFLLFIISSSSWLVFILHVPFSLFGPNIFLQIFLSNTSTAYRLPVCFSVHKKVLSWPVMSHLQGHGKYSGMSLLVTLLPLSFTNPEPVVFRTLSGAEHMKRWPRGHSYSTPTKIFTTNSDKSEI